MTVRKFLSICLVLLLILLVSPLHAVPEVRLKDVAYIGGVRENQLMGIGLVTGLAGRGDSSSSVMLRNAVANLVANFGLSIDTGEIQSKNCAVVMISSDVPPFLRAGDRIDIRVSSIGDARSLEGGILLQTPLQAANGQVYALAQGTVFSGDRSNVKTVGRIPGGAIIEQDIVSSFLIENTVSVVLRTPDFVTAQSIAAAIQSAYEGLDVMARDASLVEVQLSTEQIKDPVSFIADLETLTITPGASGKVVIDSDSGIIIFGEQVRIGTVAVSYRDVQVDIGSIGFLEEDQKEQFTFQENATVNDLVESLQAVGLKTDIIISLLQAIDRAGALYGELIIM